MPVGLQRPGGDQQQGRQDAQGHRHRRPVGHVHRRSVGGSHRQLRGRTARSPTTAPTRCTPSSPSRSAYATETGFTADAGLSCTGPVPNAAGTGYTRVCTTTAPLASGASLARPAHADAEHRRRRSTRLTVTGIAAKASGNVTDPVTDQQQVVGQGGHHRQRRPGDDAQRAELGRPGRHRHHHRHDHQQRAGRRRRARPIVTVVGGTIQSVSSRSRPDLRRCRHQDHLHHRHPGPVGYDAATSASSCCRAPSSTVTSLTATSTASVLGGITVTDPEPAATTWPPSTVSHRLMTASAAIEHQQHT